FWKDYLYVGNNDSVIRFRYRAGQTAAEGAPEKIGDLAPSDAALDEGTRSVLEGLSVRRQQRLGDSVSLSRRSNGRRRRAGENRRPAAERCGARRGHPICSGRTICTSATTPR